jgi:hypothetical protein
VADIPIQVPARNQRRDVGSPSYAARLRRAAQQNPSLHFCGPTGKPCSAV